ncbi:TDP-N-acetylfucosamine:lipid II N-acetylfucosaminyltransferase [Flavobacterium sp.]|uniref:TDP-N-acetylfucosamine:lipid II N-acetylfucosaminyltransferase n=1 Tax=Flavobacterium sp. TaxID=239 RepID=UPI0028BF40AC|nr:TDP-N-acetylfucosamine:lipid II N-acetylfucosaminyltransferase [Flavobacterium sp.]
MKKILHLVNDEKFIGFAHQSFTRQENVQNDFWVLSSAESLKHITFSCRLLTLSEFYTEETTAIVNSYDLVVIHFLDVKYDQLLQNTALKPKILWIGWGGDYYWLADTLSDFHMYKPLTRKLVSKILGNRLLYFFAKKVNRIRRKKRLALINKSISYFAPVLPDDYQLIKKSHADFKPKFIQWNYGNLEENYVKGYEDFTVTANDILLGNSATPTNNHLDVFKVLGKNNLGSRKIIMPLNYGDLNYGKIIGIEAVRFFPQQANVLSDFMPYADYMKLLQSCGNVVMGHVRQQALGNIIAMLYVGAKLFFYEDSITYAFFKNQGFIVFTLEELAQKPELLDVKLDPEIVLSHRSKLITIWGKQQNMKNTNNVILLK